MHSRRGLGRWQVNRPAKIKLEGAERPIACRLRNINLKGLQVALAHKLQKDTFVKLDVVLTDDCVLEVEAWVAWHRNIEGQDVYGLYFTKIRDSDREKIYQFMRKNFPGEMAKEWWKDLRTEKGGELMEDRRIFARFKASFPIRFLSPAGEAEGLAQAEDFSAKGIGLLTSEELPARTPLEMWLKIPDKGEALYTRGEVVWSRRVENDGYRVGVNLEKAEFMGLSRILRAL